LKEQFFIVNGKRHKVRLPKLEGEGSLLVEVDGKRVRVRLKEEFRHGSPFTLKIGGKPRKVELNKFNRNAPFPIKIDDKTYTVQHETIKTVLPITHKPSLPKLERKTVRKAVLEGGVVTAPMPGRVVLLNVKAGDSVHIGDALCILEAMKMENEITAPRTGVVKEIRVSEGANVNNGDTLIIIE